MNIIVLSVNKEKQYHNIRMAKKKSHCNFLFLDQDHDGQ